MGDAGDGVVEANKPPKGQPELWCQWVPAPEGTAIVWNGFEKFYSSEVWLQYLIDQFLQPWGYAVSGSVNWSIEEHQREGTIEVTGNRVRMTELR